MQKAGFSMKRLILMTQLFVRVFSAFSLLQEVEVLKAKNIFSRNVIWSEEEDSMSERLPHRLWPDGKFRLVHLMGVSHYDLNYH